MSAIRFILLDVRIFSVFFPFSFSQGILFHLLPNRWEEPILRRQKWQGEKKGCSWLHYFGWGGGFLLGRAEILWDCGWADQRLVSVLLSLSLSGLEEEVALVLLWREFSPTVKFSPLIASPTVSEALLVRPVVELGSYRLSARTGKDTHHLLGCPRVEPGTSTPEPLPGSVSQLFAGEQQLLQSPAVFCCCFRLLVTVNPISCVHPTPCGSCYACGASMTFCLPAWDLVSCAIPAAAPRFLLQPISPFWEALGPAALGGL